MSVLKRAGRWVIGLSPLIAGLFMHGLAMFIVLAVLVLALAILGCGTYRWTLSNEERSDRMIRMISAWRGKSQSPRTEVAHGVSMARALRRS